MKGRGYICRIAQGLGIDPFGKDRQSLVEEILKEKSISLEMNEDKPYTIKYQKHQPVSFTYYVKYANGHYKHPVDYVGEDAARMFVTLMERESIAIKEIYDKVVPLKPLTDEQKQEFQSTRDCHICSAG